MSRKRPGHPRENLAKISCVELWRLCFADIGEVAIYCPECAEREFGE